MKPKLTPASSKPCPCTSGQPYRLCCGPYHAGTEAPSALALMRSRYGAFAVGSPDYLYRTLHPAHTDRSKPREAVMRELIWAAQNNRYLGLTILDHDEADATGTARVLFWARVFQRGNDVSIVELSEFQQAEGGWRYLAGDCRSAELVEGDLATLTIALWRAADEAARAEDEAASAAGEAAPAP